MNTNSLHIPINLTRDQLVRCSRSWLSTPYRHQAAVRGIGCDCLGLIRGILKDIHGKDIVKDYMPGYTPNWSEKHPGEPFVRLASRFLIKSAKRASFDGLPADVLVVRLNPRQAYKHCAIITKRNPLTIIHAYGGHAVEEVAIRESWLARSLLFHFPGIRD